jgi:outer membrane autotransporter protein
MLDNVSLIFISLLGPSGPSAEDTQSSLNSLGTKLRGAFSSQTMATNFANMNTYDCNLFDEKGLCVSVGGQQTYIDSPSANMTSAVVVAGYKVSPTLRIGGFLNQNVNSNTGSNVDISNNSPLMGLFAVWNQNENHLGYQVKIANAYQDMDVTTTRDVIGTSEAGRGKTDLNTQSYVGELSYAFLTNEDKTLVRPYAAVRYTRLKQDGYTERTTSDVTAPLTYASLSDRSTAALVGVKLNHKLTDKVNLTGSLGVEQDLNHDVDNLTASGVSGLTSEAFNNNINRTRPVASIGAYYMPVKNQRIAADVYYQELPFQSTAATTAYVNYMIGF